MSEFEQYTNTGYMLKSWSKWTMIIFLNTIKTDFSKESNLNPPKCTLKVNAAKWYDDVTDNASDGIAVQPHHARSLNIASRDEDQHSAVG